MVAVIAADIAFAVDSIPAAFAVTRDPLVIRILAADVVQISDLAYSPSSLRSSQAASSPRSSRTVAPRLERPKKQRDARLDAVGSC